jgi:hypothetical protein
MQSVGQQMTIRGEPAFERGSIALQPCIRWVQDPNHDAVMRIGSEAPKRRTHSLLRRDKPWSPSGHRHLEPSSATHHKWTGWGKTVGCFCVLRSLYGTQNDAVGHHALPHERHRAIRSLRAKGTIMVLRVPRAFSVRARNHCAKPLSFWNIRNRHANWIMPRRTRRFPDRASPFSRRFSHLRAFSG